MRFSFVILSLLFLSSCTKDETTTSIKGIVTNQATGLPMPNVFMILEGDDYLDHYFFDTCHTNQLGEYNLSMTGKDVKEVNLFINHPGFADIKYTMPVASDNIKDIQLSPIDSYIRIRVLNKLSMSEAIYGTFWTEFLERQSFTAANTLYILLKYGKVFEEIRPCTGDNFIKVTWDYNYYNFFVHIPHLDSVYVSRGDTATFVITM